MALAAFGALGIAWELPSPDQAIPGLWAAALAVAVAIGAAHWSARLVAPLAGIALALSAIVGAVWWLLGPWPLVAIAAVALAIGRAGGGPKVLTVGPIWLAARMVGLSETRPDPS